MARKKVKLAWVANDSARRDTFRKRSNGLLKKVSELSTLCGVQACAIVYGPYEPNPKVWPSLPEAHNVLSRLKNMPKIEKSKKMLNQEGFLRQSISKAKEQFKKLQVVNRVNRMELTMNQSLRGKGLHGVSVEDLGDLSWRVEEKSRHVFDMMEYIKKRMAFMPKLLPAINEMFPVPMQMQMPVHMQAHMGVGKVEGNEVKRTVEHPDMLEAIQRYPLFMDKINHSHDGTYFAGDSVGMPYGETVAWPNTFFHG